MTRKRVPSRGVLQTTDYGSYEGLSRTRMVLSFDLRGTGIETRESDVGSKGVHKDVSGGWIHRVNSLNRRYL